MEATTDLSSQAWNIAHKIADQLITEKVPLSEISKVITYFRANQHKENAVTDLENFLQALVTDGKQIGHGGDAGLHYKNIKSAFLDLLFNYTKDPATILQILGWTSRLMRYYTVSPIGIEENLIPEYVRQAPQRTFQEHEIITATVVSVSPKTVKYKVEGVNITLEQTHAKTAALLSSSVGKQVKVIVTDVREDGALKKVKYHEG